MAPRRANIVPTKPAMPYQARPSSDTRGGQGFFDALLAAIEGKGPDYSPLAELRARYEAAGVRAPIITKEESCE